MLGCSYAEQLLVWPQAVEVCVAAHLKHYPEKQQWSSKFHLSPPINVVFHGSCNVIKLIVVLLTQDRSTLALACHN
jgi:hypothetical protein